VFGTYVLPSAPAAAAVAAVAGVTALNTAGVRWTARGAYALVGGTLAVLLLVIATGLLGAGGAAAPAVPADPPPPVVAGPFGVLTAAGLVFFAFAGYARIATSARRCATPSRTLRRAIVLALASRWWLPARRGGAARRAGVDRLAVEPAPLVALVDGGPRPWASSSGSGRPWRRARRCCPCWSG
jgi:APA family basic amino acid/polyamine antiporter